jgi:hypothetical protein
MQRSVRSLCLTCKLIQVAVDRMLQHKILQNKHRLVLVSTSLSWTWLLSLDSCPEYILIIFFYKINFISSALDAGMSTKTARSLENSAARTNGPHSGGY